MDGETHIKIVNAQQTRKFRLQLDTQYMYIHSLTFLSEFYKSVQV